VTAEGHAAYIGLGANLGDRFEALRAAVRGLDATPGVDVVRASPVYTSEAHTLTPGEEQPAYLNAVVQVWTRLAPEALLDVCLALERRAGRRRRRRWASRPLDLDLLVVNGLTRNTDRLTLPHPRLAERRFVLQPLHDLAPDLYVPLPFDATVDDLLRATPDRHALRRTDLVLWPPEDG
jgi:2-amino-4-hydroxy-6-hydroxymethyldihydropteridine diphosphokinase